MVVFVRHALPGERVTVEITEDSGRFLRADAVAVEAPSPHRVSAPCAYAGPGACGGCDFQHVDPAEQRRLKAAVVSEQLVRLAGIEREVDVEAVPVGQGPDALGWRSRMQYVHLEGGARGLRKHRSHEVVPIDRCLIAAPDAREPGEGTVVEHVDTTRGAHDFEVAADGFWQPHLDAPRTLVECVLDLLAARPGETALDLYAGVGLFTSFLADAVGPQGSVIAVEGDRRAAGLARTNLADHPHVQVIGGRVDRVLHRGLGTPDREATADLVVLDPPRAGAKRQVVRAVAALEPRAVAYVACDPAALARDLGYFAELGYRLETLRAFDLFPMTSHTECVALLEPADACARMRGRA